jgi:hypothetical protein
VIETYPEKLLSIARANPVIAKIFENQWAHFATLDPESAKLHRYLNGDFVEYKSSIANLPTAGSSRECYSEHREHLPFTRIIKS